jgi:hypothetical protein
MENGARQEPRRLTFIALLWMILGFSVFLSGSLGIFQLFLNPPDSLAYEALRPSPLLSALLRVGLTRSQYLAVYISRTLFGLVAIVAAAGFLRSRGWARTALPIVLGAWLIYSAGFVALAAYALIPAAGIHPAWFEVMGLAAGIAINGILFALILWSLHVLHRANAQGAPPS